MLIAEEEMVQGVWNNFVSNPFEHEATDFKCKESAEQDMRRKINKYSIQERAPTILCAKEASSFAFAKSLSAIHLSL